MKILYLISWICFSTGVAFQFIHFPFGGFLLFIGCVFLWIHGLVHLGKNRKTNLTGSLYFLVIASLTSYVMCRMQYWGWAKLIFYFSALLTLYYLILLGRNKMPFQMPQFILLAYFVFFLFVAYTPSYRIYYLVKLNTLLNNENRDLDYRSWDRYSWFLYLRDKQVEALDANNRAKKAVKVSPDRDAAAFATAIELHALQIKEKKWESYP